MHVHTHALHWNAQTHVLQKKSNIDAFTFMLTCRPQMLNKQLLTHTHTQECCKHTYIKTDNAISS